MDLDFKNQCSIAYTLAIHHASDHKYEELHLRPFGQVSNWQEAHDISSGTLMLLVHVALQCLFKKAVRKSSQYHISVDICMSIN